MMQYSTVPISNTILRGQCNVDTDIVFVFGPSGSWCLF